MEIIAITSAEELFLDDISAEDYQELIEDHSQECNCKECRIFERLLELEQSFWRFINNLPVELDLRELMQKKYDKFSS